MQLPQPSGVTLNLISSTQKTSHSKEEEEKLWKFPLMDDKLLFFYNNSTVIPHS